MLDISRMTHLGQQKHFHCNNLASGRCYIPVYQVSRKQQLPIKRRKSPRLQPYLISFCYLGALPSQLFYIVRSALAVYCMLIKSTR